MPQTIEAGNAMLATPPRASNRGVPFLIVALVVSVALNVLLARRVQTLTYQQPNGSAKRTENRHGSSTHSRTAVGRAT